MLAPGTRVPKRKLFLYILMEKGWTLAMQSSQLCLELKCNLGLLCLLWISASLLFMFYLCFFFPFISLPFTQVDECLFLLLWSFLLQGKLITSKHLLYRLGVLNLPHPPGSEPNEFLIAFSFLSLSSFIIL